MDAEDRSDQQQNFDQWLDSAMRARIDAEPRMGLEERVLARLVSEPRHRFAWWPALATAAAAVIVIAIAIALLRPTQPGGTIANRTAEPASASSPGTAPTHAGSASRTASIHKSRKSLFSSDTNARCCGSTLTVAQVQREQHLPKLASFPTAHPETDQERLLAQLAAQVSAQRRFSEIANVSLNAPPKDLSITELRIEPLEGTPADSNPH